ncbi:hypothetical protein [Lactobacillus sp. LL6]|uniref:hypothetical protein n=1 Tax=Lactobacillus sp. LL6 TaxID=2596827 RepID=UPI001184CA3F|nr:hypothetical protein [Lactobacillus sp. LL6]TSO25309.1 hypothetical protein FOD82_08710 [Lactobacillus sp. LL6]
MAKKKIIWHANIKSFNSASKNQLKLTLEGKAKDFDYNLLDKIRDIASCTVILYSDQEELNLDDKTAEGQTELFDENKKGKKNNE